MQNYPAPCADPLDYVPFLNLGWRKPTHLRALGDLAIRIAAWARGDSDEVIRVAVTYPIRHWKTETILALIVWLLEQFPWLNIMLLAYDDDRVTELGKKLRELCQRVSDRTYIGPAPGWNRVDRWRNSEGGGVVILGYKQSREGFTVHALICDDPINEIQVVKPDERKACDDAIVKYTGRTLLYRDGGNVQGPVVIVASRFSQDDMIGRRKYWEQFHSPAILPSGEAFAPHVFTRPQLDRIRSDYARTDPREEIWYSRWQGTPKEERGQNRFKPEPAVYDFLPKGVDAIGIDFIGERSIWFALVHVRISAGMMFVRQCVRFMAEPNELARRVTEIRNEHGMCEVYGFMGQPERIALRRLQERGIVVTPMVAGQNRLWRTLRTIQLWETDRILWPRDGSGAESIDRFTKFTGGEDEDNEEIDALVAVVEGAMLWTSASKPEWVGQRRQLP